MTTARAVTDGRMTNEELGLLTRRVDEIKRRINEGTIQHDWVVTELQRVAEGRKALPLAVSSMIVKRGDRARIFDPSPFLGVGSTIWRGPANGNGLEGELDQDQRSLAITKLNLGKVQLNTTFLENDVVVNGEERLRRLKAKSIIRLDAMWFQKLWENKHLIPEQWKEKTSGNTTYVFFDGTILRRPNGRRCVLCLHWDGEAWDWDTLWLDIGFFVRNPSAVLAS